MKGRPDDHQLTLDFLHIPTAPKTLPGSLDFEVELRNLISSCLKETSLSRFEIAARMSELLGAEVGKHSLDSWSAESRKSWRFPLSHVAAFEEAVGTLALTEWLAARRGCKLLVGSEALLAEVGRLERMEQQVKARKKLLKQALKGI